MRFQRVAHLQVFILETLFGIPPKCGRQEEFCPPRRTSAVHALRRRFAGVESICIRSDWNLKGSGRTVLNTVMLSFASSRGSFYLAFGGSVPMTLRLCLAMCPSSLHGQCTATELCIELSACLQVLPLNYLETKRCGYGI